MKNGKIKTFFCLIGSFIAGIIATISTILLHNRKSTDGTRKSITDAEERNSKIKLGIDNAENTCNGLTKSVERVEQSVERIADSVDTSENIFDAIRKQQIKN